VPSVYTFSFLIPFSSRVVGLEGAGAIAESLGALDLDVGSWPYTGVEDHTKGNPAQGPLRQKICPARQMGQRGTLETFPAQVRTQKESDSVQGDLCQSLSMQGNHHQSLFLIQNHHRSRSPGSVRTEESLTRILQLEHWIPGDFLHHSNHNLLQHAHENMSH
jgi:hypothetical protein